MRTALIIIIVVLSAFATFMSIQFETKESAPLWIFIILILISIITAFPQAKLWNKAEKEEIIPLIVFFALGFIVSACTINFFAINNKAYSAIMVGIFYAIFFGLTSLESRNYPKCTNKETHFYISFFFGGISIGTSIGWSIGIMYVTGLWHLLALAVIAIVIGTAFGLITRKK